MVFIRDLGMVANKSGNRFRMELYKCEQCSNDFEVYAHNMKKHKNEFCKTCTQRNRTITHGKSNTKSYEVWKNMMGRCYRESSKNFKNWGGRGISVCDSWKDFTCFDAWFLENYKDGLQIDRIDNDGNYEPSNCRFISRGENLRNKRSIIGKKGKYRYILWQSKTSGWRAVFKGRHIGYSKDEEVAYNMLTKDIEYQEYIKGREIFRDNLV